MLVARGPRHMMRGRMNARYVSPALFSLSVVYARANTLVLCRYEMLVKAGSYAAMVVTRTMFIFRRFSTLNSTGLDLNRHLNRLTTASTKTLRTTR